MPERVPRKDDFTVAWVCALYVELSGCRLMLDEEYEDLDLVVPQSDPNCYVFGRVKQHKIVVACLPNGSYGVSSTTAVVSNLKTSFQNIQLGVLVGIAGGAPTECDIRLGDVVVSEPQGQTGGILQYNSGKRLVEGFVRGGALDRPASKLLHATSVLRSNEQIGKSKLLGNLVNLPENFERPKSRDVLYKPTFHHVEDREIACDQCKADEQVEREERIREGPKIHFGIIGSGDELIKDPEWRDDIASKYGALCFEMEAAGVMNVLPCLVVRGICDYCDSHKNEIWQPYAAVVAAAWAKELLNTVKPVEIDSLAREMQQGIEQVQTAVQNIATTTLRDKVKGWLGCVDQSTKYHSALNERVDGSGATFIQSARFQQWKDSEDFSFLWLHGKVGCGKTVLSSSIVEHLESYRDKDTDALVYFYFNFEDDPKPLYSTLLRTLVFKFCQNTDIALWKQLIRLYEACENGYSQPTNRDLEALLSTCFGYYATVYLILDALDECEDIHRTLSWLARLFKGSENLKLLVTSRDDYRIRVALEREVDRHCFMSIEGDILNPEIRAYVRTRLFDSTDFEMWKGSNVLERVESEIMRKVDSMFKWAVCQLDVLKDCVDAAQMDQALRSLPDGLDETYHRIIMKIPSVLRPKAILLLQAMLISSRPLRLEEAVDIMATDLTRLGSTNFDPASRMPDPVAGIAKLCPALLKLSPAERRRDFPMGAALGNWPDKCCHYYYYMGCPDHCSQAWLPYDQIHIDNRRASRNGEEKCEVRFAHFSVKEYLESNRLKAPIASHFVKATVRERVVTACLTYLLQLHRTKYEGYAIEWDFPWTRHAAEHCFSHANTAETCDQTNPVIPILTQFLTSGTAYNKSLTLWDPHEELQDSPGGDVRWAYCSRQFMTPLYYASLLGSPSTVRALARSQDFDVTVERLHCALLAAISEGYIGCVRVLLTCHNKPIPLRIMQASDEEKGMAVAMATEGTRVFNLDALHDFEKIRDSTRGPFGPTVTSLNTAIAHGHKDIVRLLLSTGFPIARGDVTTAAGLEEHGLSMVQILVDEGADVNEVFEDWRYTSKPVEGTPLQTAINAGNIELIFFLLHRGADIDVPPGSLTIAARTGITRVFEICLHRCADLNAGAGEVGTALQTAVYDQHEGFVTQLLHKGADPNAMGSRFSDTYGDALICACVKGSEAIVRRLLVAQANVDTFGLSTNTFVYGNALQVTFHLGHYRIVDLLLDFGANPAYMPKECELEIYKTSHWKNFGRAIQIYTYPTFSIHAYQRERESLRRQYDDFQSHVV